MNDNYTYPVILSFIENEAIEIVVPDFNNTTTCIELNDDIVVAAQDLLTILISDYENEFKKLPEPTKVQNIKLKQNQQVVLVNVWMPYHRCKIKEVYVKKTLTIPEWLNILAINNNINFSSTLVEALKNKLNIK